MPRIGVMQMLDTLEVGGAERVAVTIANHLPRDRYVSCLCTTRRDGPLEDSIAADVHRLSLGRKGWLDPAALRNLLRFAREREIKVIHAHGSTVFLSSLVCALRSSIALIWHPHWGRFAAEDRRAPFYRLAAIRVDGVITVNQGLVEWCRRRMGVPRDRVWYIPNPVPVAGPATPTPAAAPVALAPAALAPVLPGAPGLRIACVANFRPEKDHRTLIEAMAQVVRRFPEAHLLLIGGVNSQPCLRAAKDLVRELGIERNISFLGQRQDVPSILAQCDVGVICSVSEGLPMALLEYGMAGIAPVATDVGQCAAVLDGGRAGILVPPGSAAQLAEALLKCLGSPEYRGELAAIFRERVMETHHPARVVERICSIYETVLSEREPGARVTEAKPVRIS